MNKDEKQTFIAKRVAKELEEGELINLGIGLPTKVANFVPDDMEVIFQSENGFTGLAPLSENSNDKTIINAGGQAVAIKKGGAFFDSSTSFGLIRGGHVDLTVLGALEVDKYGNIANYMVPKKFVPGMGGAMDLLTGAKKVIVAMEHTNKGNHKIVEECTLPLTATNAVDLIVTEMGVMKIENKNIYLIEKNPNFTIEEVQEATGVELIISNQLSEQTV